MGKQIASRASSRSPAAVSSSAAYARTVSSMWYSGQVATTEVSALTQFGPYRADMTLRQAKRRYPRLKRLWVDSAYERSHLPAWALVVCSFVLEVVRRAAGAVGFVVLARRWVVERTFAWLHNRRRLLLRTDRQPETQEAFLDLACCLICWRRIETSFS